MCICFFGLDLKPGLVFLLAFNRDEYIVRPTLQAHRWEDQPHILGGRDVQAGGTWLGVNVKGRVAFLTNLRAADPDPNGAAMAHKRSRGELPTNFLLSKQSPMEYCQAVRGSQYHGFNLVCVDLHSRKAAYMHNAPQHWYEQHVQNHGEQLKDTEKGSTAGGAEQPTQHRHPKELKPGQVYGLSNALLGEWRKVESGVDMLQELLQNCQDDQGDPFEVPWECLFDALLGDSARDDTQRPRCQHSGDLLDPSDVNADEHIEYVASSRFVQLVPSKSGPYGTRSMTVLAVWEDGSAELREKYLDTASVTSPQSAAVTDNFMSSKTTGNQSPVEQARSTAQPDRLSPPPVGLQQADKATLFDEEKQRWHEGSEDPWINGHAMIAHHFFWSSQAGLLAAALIATLACTAWQLHSNAKNDESVQPQKRRKHSSAHYHRGMREKEYLPLIPRKEFKQVCSVLLDIYNSRGWSDNKAKLRSAWDVIETKAQANVNGGWQLQFPLTSMDSERLQKLAKVIDDILFGGQLQAWLEKQGQQVVRYQPLRMSVGPDDWFANFYPQQNTVAFKLSKWSEDSLIVMDSYPANYEGIHCINRLQVLCHTMAHEMIHALVYHRLPHIDASCAAYLADDRHGPIFRLLSNRILGHSTEDFKRTYIP